MFRNTLMLALTVALIGTAHGQDTSMTLKTEATDHPLVSVRIDESGSLLHLGREGGEDLLAGPVRIRIVERQFGSATTSGRSPDVHASRVEVANQDTVFDALKWQSVHRRVHRTIEDAGIVPERLTRDRKDITQVKSDPTSKLTWTTVIRTSRDGAEFSMTFRNLADRRRSLDVEFPIVLAGADYTAFFPGQNDFPEWPRGGALAYGLRYNDSDYTCLSQPLGTLFCPARNIGLTVAGDYRYPIAPITFFAGNTPATTLLVTFPRVRLDPNGQRTITLHLVPHAGDWRCGLAYARAKWPQWFMRDRAVSKFHTPLFGGSPGMGHCYPNCFTQAAFWKNYMWRGNVFHRGTIEMMGLYPWYGQWIGTSGKWTPCLSDKWYHVNKNPQWFSEAFLKDKPALDAPYRDIVAWLESRPESMFKALYQKGLGEHQDQTMYNWYPIGHDDIRTFIRTAHEHGFDMFFYWNPRDVWYPYARAHFPDLIVNHISDYFNVDCGICNAPRDSAFYKWQLAQIKALFAHYPEVDGFFIDQGYGDAASENYDDGWTITDDGNVQSNFNGNLAGLIAAAARIAHDRGKWVWANHTHEIIDIVGNSDLALSEDRQCLHIGQEVGRYALIGNRPCVNLHQRGEAVPQVSLRNGVTVDLFGISTVDTYATRLTDNPAWMNRLYAPLFDLFRDRTWCLEPHALTLPEGFDGNLFRIDQDESLLATVVAFGESFASAWTRLEVPIRVCVSDADAVKAAYVIGAANLGPCKVPFTREGRTISVAIPRLKGSAAVLLAKKGRFVSLDTALPIASAGGTWQYNLAIDNFDDQPWDWKGTLWNNQAPTWFWEIIPPGASCVKPFTITMDANYAHPYAQALLAKEVPSRLPVDDTANNHVATFEFFVEPTVAASLAPSRSLVQRTLSNSSQDGYKPFSVPHPLHLYQGETAEFVVGLSNHSASEGTFDIACRGDGVRGLPATRARVVPAHRQASIPMNVRGEKRGPSRLDVDIQQKGKGVAKASLALVVIGTTLSDSELRRVRDVAMLYDLWGTTKTSGADAKEIRLNGKPVGTLVGNEGGPIWIYRIRAKLKVPVDTLAPVNRVVLDNPTASFWKIRNLILECVLDDGSIVHLRGEKTTYSSPAENPWAEGTGLKPGQALELIFNARAG